MMKLLSIILMSISFNIHANSIDIMMEELTKEPYKSDSDKFIEYVINNNLMLYL